MADNEYIKRSEVVALIEDKLKLCKIVLEALDLASLRTKVMGLRSADVAPRAEWISVEERLPDRDGVFLVSLKESGYENLVYFDVRPYADGEWRNLPDKLTVSRWMPIPNPPKGD